MTRLKGLSSLAIAGLAMVSPSALAEPCPEMMQPDHWRAPLVLIDHAAKDGPPEIARAAAALHAGNRAEGVAWLQKVDRISEADLLRPPINRPYIEAVLIARENIWVLQGCPDDPPAADKR